MKVKKYLLKSPVVLGLMILLIAAACNQVQNPTPEPASDSTDNHDKEVELALIMSRLQLYMNKLYFSGINDNTELRDFYVHEIEESMEEISGGNVTHEGVDISQNMQMFGLSQLEVFEQALAEEADFSEAYGDFVNACNSCHTASKYPFIIIKEPTNPVFDNQVYEIQ